MDVNTLALQIQGLNCRDAGLLLTVLPVLLGSASAARQAGLGQGNLS
jgi:hypothetical protein